MQGRSKEDRLKGRRKIIKWESEEGKVLVHTVLYGLGLEAVDFKNHVLLISFIVNI